MGQGGGGVRRQAGVEAKDEGKIDSDGSIGYEG
jgi:hypothetical protein